MFPILPLPVAATHNNDQPLVSIVVTYYNQIAFIQDAVGSALAQDYPAIEVIVVDDGSRQEAHDFLLTVSGNARVIRQPNAGVSVARNTGLAAAQGKYVVFLDGDDRLMRSAVSSHVRALAGREDTGLIFAAQRKMNEAGVTTSAPYVCAPRRNYFRSMLEVNVIQCPASAMMLREALVAVGGFDKDYNYAEDRDVYIRIARSYPVVRHTALVAERRMHGSNASHNFDRAIRNASGVLDKAERELGLSRAERRCVRAARTRIGVYYSHGGGMRKKLQVNYLRMRSLAQSSLTESFREEFVRAAGRVELMQERLAIAGMKLVPRALTSSFGRTRAA